MSNLPIYLFGEVLFDCFPNTEPVLGGAPFNVAWHLRAFGETPQLITAVGSDELGSQIQQSMAAWRMSTDYVQVDKKHATGIVNVEIDNGEPHYHIREDVAYDFIEAQNLPPLDSDALFYHGTLALRNATSKHSCETLKGDARRKRFIDVNLRSPWWQLEEVVDSLYCAFCVKLNSEELRLLAQSDDSNFEDYLEIAVDFKQKNNIVNLLLTRGEQGALLIDANGDLYSAPVTPPSKPVVDTVGAGDAFAAIAILGIQRDWDWQTTLERAQQFASFIVTQRGATCPNPAVYQDFRNFWHVL